MQEEKGAHCSVKEKLLEPSNSGIEIKHNATISTQWKSMKHIVLALNTILYMWGCTAVKNTRTEPPSYWSYLKYYSG